MFKERVRFQTQKPWKLEYIIMAEGRRQQPDILKKSQQLNDVVWDRSVSVMIQEQIKAPLKRLMGYCPLNRDEFD
jgi:hypothetical protein